MVNHHDYSSSSDSAVEDRTELWLDLRYIVSPSLPQRSFNFIPHKQQWCTLVFV